MSLRRSHRLHVETLESRITPAVSVRFLPNGLLYIQGDNVSNDLRIVETPTPGKFAVINNGKGLGSYSFSNLIVRMGNGNDTLDLRVKTHIGGNVTAIMGNGGDLVTTEFSDPSAQIRGNVLVNLGLGSKLAVAAKVGGLYDQAALFENIKIGGNVTVIGPVGNGAELVNFSNASVGGSIHTVNIYATSLGDILPPVFPVSVGGNITVSNVQKNTDSRTFANAQTGPGNNLFFFNEVSVGGNVTYTGGFGRDSVNLPGDEDVETAPLIGGNVTFNNLGGEGTLALGNETVGPQVGGSVYFNGGAGIDRLYLDSGTDIAGSLIANLGEGDNQIFGNSVPILGFGKFFDPIGTASIGGDLIITAGNGNNFLATYETMNGATLTVAGNLSITFGNGDNVGSPAVAPSTVITFFNENVSVGGTATYRAGTGRNHLDITNESISNLRLLFSGGDTDLLFNQPSGTFFGNLFIDFGIGFGPKNIGGTAGFGGLVTILNY